MGDVSVKLELPPETQRRLDELRELSEKAEDGDKEARAQLKQMVRESSPEVIARASDVARRAQHVLIKTAAGGEPLTEYALSGRLDLLRAAIAGESPTPLESLLTEQIVSLWLWLQLHDALLSGQFQRKMPEGTKSVAPSYIRHMVKLQESAHRRFLASVTALARVRKLQSATPAVQVNTQINLPR